MLGQIFITLSGIPGLKKRLWRAWYEYLAAAHRAPEWTFMNYGYAGDGRDHLALAQSDEPDRHCIQLYNHVAAVDLTGLVVLEVGSGRGGGSSFIKRYRRPKQMIGVDLSKNAVNFCRTIHAMDGLEFRVGDAENLPLNDGAIDAVINVESSHCYPSLERFLSEVHRVLKPGGHFLYADFRSRDGLEDWTNLLRNSGLVVTRTTDITANVIDALDQDSDRKRDLIDRLVPGILRPSFFDFAAVRGTTLFDSFQSGKLVYMSFALQKAR